MIGQSNERDDLLEWYYKQSKGAIQRNLGDYSRLKRSGMRRNRITRQIDNNYDYSDNSDENDDWYVFDRVEDPGPVNNGRSIGPSWQNNQNQINGNNNNRPPSPNTFFSSTTQQPVIPNAGPPRLPPCEENCNARTTSEYNPVCGTNGVTYFNNGRFECAQFCGRSNKNRLCINQCESKCLICFQVLV